jgi:CheY-like chemotaxis protein
MSADFSQTIHEVSTAPEVLLIQHGAADVDDVDHAVLIRRALHEVAPEARLRIVRTGEAVPGAPWETTGRRPDLVLLDLGPPWQPGGGSDDVAAPLRALEALKNDAATRHIPVIVLTGTDEERVRRAHALRADGYVFKPETTTQLRHAIGSVLRFWGHVVRPIGRN